MIVLAGAVAGSDPWQSSVGAEVQLGVRRPGARGFTATFRVDSPDKRVFRKSLEVAGDTFGYVRFPSDFATDLRPGTYRWTATVEGREVTGGRFGWRTDASGRRVLELD